MQCLMLAVLVGVVSAIPNFVVDLDVAPEERWKDVVQYYVESGIAQAMVEHDKHPEAVMPPGLFEEWWKVIEPQVDEEFKREADGFVKYGAQNNITLTRQSLLVSAHLYEQNFPSYSCSGLIAAYPNGTVVHGRNMDYGDMNIMLNGKPAGWSELSIEVTFLRDGQPLYTSVTWPMQLGIHTAMRFGGWSFEQNTRRTGDDASVNLAAAKTGAIGFGLYARRLMERVPDFQTAVKELWSANLMASQYFIMTGAKPYEGAVLSVDRFGQHEQNSPGLTLLSDLHSRNKAWHIIQTNDDLNKPPEDERRPIEEQLLSMSQQAQVSPKWVLGQMHSFPLLNEGTAFSWVAIPATGYHEVALPSETVLGLPPAEAVLRKVSAHFLQPH